MIVVGDSYEYLLQCGYYPDLIAERELPPDVFFMHLYEGSDVQQAFEDIVDAIRDKYKLDMGGPFSRIFNVQDCFWSCDEKRVEGYVQYEACPHERVQPGGACDDCGAQVYIGADDEYPENAS